MSKSILHITNGDHITKYLKELEFNGDFITWREILCEGKTLTNVGSESFWKNRFNYFKSSFKLTKQNFINFTLKEYRELCNKKNTDEIVLWFDYDLNSQINMLAIISWLKRYRKGYHISLVSNKNIKKFEKSTKNQLHKLFKSRIELKLDDIEYADYIWQLYCSDSPLRLETIYRFNPMSPFNHLANAIETHILRFPSIENGLNNLENTILEYANAKNFKSKDELISGLIKNEKSYGFNSQLYENKINSLRKLFYSFNPTKLNKRGIEVLKNNSNFYGQIRNENTYLGGAKKYSFLYNYQNNKLLQITS